MNSQEYGRLTEAQQNEIQRIADELGQLVADIRYIGRRGRDCDQLVNHLMRLTTLRSQLDQAIAGEVGV
jgi:hypothetical protein